MKNKLISQQQKIHQKNPAAMPEGSHKTFQEFKEMTKQQQEEKRCTELRRDEKEKITKKLRQLFGP